MDGKAKLQCRLWWPLHHHYHPHHLHLHLRAHRILLLGWASHNISKSLDLVVASSCADPSIDPRVSDPFLQVMIRSVTERLPTELQERATFSVIGECTFIPPHQDHKNNSLSSKALSTIGNQQVENCLQQQEVSGFSKGAHGHTFQSGKSKKKRSDNDSDSLHKRLQNGFVETSRTNTYRKNVAGDTWIELLIQPLQQGRSLYNWVPEMLNLSIQGHCCSPDFHVIFYEQPKLASHHYSIRPWNFISQTGQPQESLAGEQMKADWVIKLEKHKESPDIDLVILQLNCATAAEQSVKHSFASLDTACKRSPLRSILTSLFRHLIAATIALLAIFYYILVQAGFNLFNTWPFIHVNIILAKLFKLTHRNIRIRCHELTGWPFILLWRGCGRDQQNIEAAHIVALVRHSTWSAIVFDLFFGILAGAFFLCYQSDINHYIRSIARSLTDDILRTGCIWLMGVPAGFKLNTQLAETLGLVSLNMIQVWSTLLYFLKPVFGPCLFLFAISGMLLGITVPAAMIADMLFLATFHISTLHQLVAFLYSNQLQALAALWRLFRGRKRNTLRGRIDTYDYSVEQHVVGSLMFTPLLLLLPTTSVFYIFFTMLYTSLSIVRLALQFFIAILHCFPYAQVATWLVQPRRFPSGIWFEVLPIQEQVFKAQQHSLQKQDSSPTSGGKLVSSLGIKTASIGELLSPYMKQLGGGLTWSSCALCIYKIFSGERWPSSVELGTPVLPPWTNISVKKYWWLCYDAVLVSI